MRGILRLKLHAANARVSNTNQDGADIENRELNSQAISND
jgi:hypothetical protein